MNFAVIVPNLLVGPQPCETADFEELKSYGVTAILSLQSEEDLNHRIAGWAEAEAGSAGMVFFNKPVLDFDMLDLKCRLPYCVKAVENLIKDGHTVYLHCTAGVNRSPTVAAAYLHWCLKWPLDQALRRVMEARECCPLGDLIHRARPLEHD